MKKRNTIIAAASVVVLILIGLGLLFFTASGERFSQKVAWRFQKIDQSSVIGLSAIESIPPKVKGEDTKMFMVVNDVDPRVAKMKYRKLNSPIWFGGELYATDLGADAFKFEPTTLTGGPPDYAVRCAADDSVAEKIDLFYSYANAPVMGGAGRFAYVCEDQYVIADYTDHAGYVWVGPFKLQ